MKIGGGSDNRYLKRILAVLTYIEDHIDQEMTIDELAKVACYSPFHFHRIFQAVVGENVHKYVRRLRLERAAGRLKRTDKPVTDLALDARFDTPSSFTKAFKNYMGSSPRSYRQLNKEIEAMTTKKINELLMINPEKIEIISDIEVFFMRRHGSYSTSAEEAFHALGDFVEKNNLDMRTLRYFSIGHDDPEVAGEDTMRFDACIKVPEGVVLEDDDIGRRTIAGGKYAIFVHHGPHQKMDETFDRIVLQWLPKSGEEYDDTRPTFSELFNLEYVHKDERKLVTKIYVPLV